jgi:hypothetical protein
MGRQCGGRVPSQPGWRTLRAGHLPSGLRVAGSLPRRSRLCDAGHPAQAAADNAQAAGRRNPSRFVYGATTCAPGYVWREADANDYVCVTPATRSQTWADNAAAASRRNPAGGPFGPDTCLPGYVWREAFLGDHVCVTPPTRSQAAADNTAAEAHVAHA